MKDPNKTPAVVNWTGYLAMTMLLMLPIAVLTVRSGAWQEGLLLYAISCLGAALLLLVSIVMLVLPRFGHWRKAISMRAIIMLPGALLLLSLAGGSGGYPPIHDITTDIDDPPIFTVAPKQRGAGANSLELDSEVISQQQQAYADIQTIVSEAAIDEVFDRAVQVATNLGWDIYHQDRNTGVIEAVDTTSIMGFKDDVMIRVRSNAQGTLLDLRSSSRVGVSDLGANAKRIRAFVQAFNQ